MRWGDGDWGCFASFPGWKLNPVVGAVYGPEFYAGTGWSRRSGPVGGVARREAWPARGLGRGRAGVVGRGQVWLRPGRTLWPARTVSGPFLSPPLLWPPFLQ